MLKYVKCNFFVDFLCVILAIIAEKVYLCIKYNKKVITKEQVEAFLRQIKEKIKVFDIVFRDDRGKNLQTLATLEILPAYRKQVILDIEPEDYSEGPIVDTLNKMGEMWVFGKDVKGHEVYIKIMLGHPNCSTICISFHLADHPMNYPFKN